MSLIQPLIAPLYGGHSESELIEFLTNEDEASSYELTQRYWQTQHTGADFKSWWERSLHDGFVAGSAFAPKTVSAKVALPARGSRAGRRAGDYLPPRRHDLRRALCQQRLAARDSEADDSDLLG